MIKAVFSTVQLLTWIPLAETHHVSRAASVNNVSSGWHFGISPSMAGTIFLMTSYICSSFLDFSPLNVNSEIYVQLLVGLISKDWWWLLSPRAGHRNCPNIFRIVEKYWHDHSLESSWGALFDGTISFEIQPSSGKSIFWIHLKKPQSLKR
jgi:hypothetical protein